MSISSSLSSLLSQAPLAVVEECVSSCSKRIKTSDSRLSSSSSPKSFLTQLPSVLIAEIFSYSSINARASCSMRLCRSIYKVLRNIGPPHCVLDMTKGKLKFNNEIAKRFINSGNFKFIRHINFRNSGVKNPTDIFTDLMPCLKNLFIDGNRYDNKEEEPQDLSSMLNSYCSNLTLLDIENCHEDGLKGIFKIVLPHLEDLRLSGGNPISKEDLVLLTLNCSKLKRLSLELDCMGEDPIPIAAGKIAFSCLEYLNLGGSANISAKEMVSLVANNPKLQDLNLNRSEIEQGEFDHFVYPPTLTSLNLSVISCDTLDLSRIACNNLKELDISKMWNLRGHALFVQQNPSLEVLTMSFGEDAPDLGLSEFIHLKNLHTLTVFQQKNFTTELTLVGKSCSSLRSLIINCEEGVGIEETTLTKELINSCNFPLLIHLRFPTYGCDFEEGVLELLPQKFPNLSLEVLASIRKEARILENVQVMTEEKEEA